MICSTNHSNTECTYRTKESRRLVRIHFRKEKTFSTQTLIHVEELVMFCTKSGFITEAHDIRLSFQNML